MVTVNCIKPSWMNDDEFLKFHLDVIQASSCIVKSAFKPLIRNYKKSVRQLKQFVETERSVQVLGTMVELNENQLGLYRNFERYVKAMSKNSKGDWAAFASQVCNVIQDGYVPEQMTPSEATMAIKRRLLGVKALGEDPNNAKVYEESDIKHRLELVEPMNGQCAIACEEVKKRNAVLAGTTKEQLRNSCDRNYSVLTGYANVQSGMLLDHNCDEFLFALDRITFRLSRKN